MADLQKVVRQCQDGHLDAFTTLFNHFQSHIYDLACVILHDEQAAEDVVQDTFMAVFQKIGDFKGKSTFETWLTAVAVNQCRMRLRKRKIRQALSLDQLSPRRLFRSGGRRKDISDIVYERDQRQTMWQLVNNLQDSLRLPIILRYRYAMNCGDIAHVLDKKKSTIYQQLNEGRRALEKMAQQREAGSNPPALNEMPG